MKKLLFWFLVPPLIFAGVCSFAWAEDESALPPALMKVVTDARQECASFDNGKLTIGWGAVSRPDLDGDLYPDWALDMTRVSCSSARSLFCGTGGCAVHFVVDDSHAEFLAKKWQMTDLGELRVLLMRVHGANCGGTNLTPCIHALTWDADKRTWRGIGLNGD